ncbi:class I SAM-dependent methyltransferase [Methylobacterium sp. J-030]|uniref:class I SAM-dependent methyltransferase n=1 Tax=Methylobacterium sp. J-030 TaxID=2836627 RepID=UPI001FBB3B35|nr:class I SAM-dependent methyltransferase [Methylobacterium sp. J-030]MCJ2070634.1 class I SAM-dependent methyltransferase [Methylobacterium sp. J-030]
MKKAGEMYTNLFKLVKLFIAKTIVKSSAGQSFMYNRLPRAINPSGHPFDIENGTETSGFVPFYLLNSDYSARSISRAEVYPYFGCQPNCLLTAINRIPDVSRFVFYDFGCGMGRALLVASKFPFRKVVGIEISKLLCGIATRNIEATSTSRTSTCQTTVINSDILNFKIEEQSAVIFMYNPFGANIMKQIIQNLDEKIRRGLDVIIIYENPVHYYLFDESKYFLRCFGAQITCSMDEIEHSTNSDDAVAMWRAAHMKEPTCDQDFHIETVEAGWRVEIVLSTS